MTTQVSQSPMHSAPQVETAESRFKPISFQEKCANGMQSVATALKTALLASVYFAEKVFNYLANAIKNGACSTLNAVSNFFREISLASDDDLPDLLPTEQPAEMPEATLEIPTVLTQEKSSVEARVEAPVDSDSDSESSKSSESVPTIETSFTCDVALGGEEAVVQPAKLNTWVTTGAAVATVAAAVGIAHFTGYVNLTDNALVNNVREWLSTQASTPTQTPMNSTTSVVV